MAAAAAQTSQLEAIFFVERDRLLQHHLKMTQFFWGLEVSFFFFLLQGNFNGDLKRMGGILADCVSQVKGIQALTTLAPPGPLVKKTQFTWLWLWFHSIKCVFCSSTQFTHNVC